MQTEIIGRFEHRDAAAAFARLAAGLRADGRAAAAGCWLVGNYDLDGLRADALLATPGGLTLVLFRRRRGPGAVPAAALSRARACMQRRLAALPGGADMVVRVAVIVPEAAATPSAAGGPADGGWLTVCPAGDLYGRVAAEVAAASGLTAAQLRGLYAGLGLDVLLAGDGAADLPAGAERQVSAAADFYAELQAALPPAGAPAAAVREAYGVLSAVLRRAVDEQLEDNRLAFAGLFPKMDYLIKERQVDEALAREVNDARHRLRHLGQLSDERVRLCFPHDLAAVCRFIGAVVPEPVRIPETLRRRFPLAPLPRAAHRQAADCVRMAVDRWDATFVYGHAADGQPLKVRYDLHDDYHAGDWTYLRDLFSEGLQLNLLHPCEAGGVLEPELIVVDPDNLISVSAVAACFETYAESPRVELLNRLKPAPRSAAVLLGNLAGQLIDEEVRAAHLPEAPDRRACYAATVRDFFARNALSLAACPDLGADFHAEALRQLDHIRRAVREDLPRFVAPFEPADVVTEPTFFSEMLGLQGRMDFLQLDYGILVEQKSGKGAFVPGAAAALQPRHQERHYVQLLLYMALLHYNYHLPYARIYPFLFYSKYDRGLLQLGPAPALLFRALKVRNGMAVSERAYAEGGVAELASWTPELLNEKHARGPLWEQYTAPALHALLAPVREASELERAYFFRLFTFLEKEHLLSKVGSKTKEATGLSALWNERLEEKERAGNIYAGLTLERLETGEHGGVGALVLRFEAGTQWDACNFRPGDIVVCYAYVPPQEPDVRCGPVFRAVLAGFGDGTVTLRLRYEQTNARVFTNRPGGRWAVEHDFMDSSYASLYRGLHAFLQAPQRRRDLLLTLRRPETDAARPLRGHYGGGEFDELVRRVGQARDFFLLVGPPGTGKTSFGLMNVLHETLLEPGATVLLMAYTNRAVDEICSKLTAACPGPAVDFVRLGSDLSCAAPYRPYLLERRVAACTRLDQVRALIASVRVFVGTTTAFNAHPELFELKHFDLAIVDEASQILEPHLVGLLSARHDGREAIGRFLLIGDHKQLPAVVQQSAADARVTDPALLRIGLRDCRQSLFERLLARYRNDPAVCFTLTRQGRMHRDIAQFPSLAFYQGALRVVPGTHQEDELPAAGPGRNGIEDLLATRRTVFLDVPLPDRSPSDKVNPVEARVAAATVAAVRRRGGDRFDAARSVGIIVPYRNQIAAVRAALEEAGVDGAADISIDTVERYQGSQRDVIVYCFTVQHRYQLNFLAGNVFSEDGVLIDRKLNVALTRARERLVLIGHAPLLSENVTFFQLLAFLRQRGCCFALSPDDYVAGRFAVPPRPADAGTRLPALRAGAAVATAFARRVVAPLRAAGPAEWPQRVLGATAEEQWQWLAYGRARFRQPLVRTDAAGRRCEVTPRQLAALYALRFLPAHLAQLAALGRQLGGALRRVVEKGDGRLRLVDVGCGPGTAGLALADGLPDLAERTHYVGVDRAAAMTGLAAELLRDATEGRLAVRFAERLTLAEETAPDAPGTTLFVFMHSTVQLGAGRAARLARAMKEAAGRTGRRRLLVLVVDTETDAALRAHAALAGEWRTGARLLLRRTGLSGDDGVLPPAVAELWWLAGGDGAGAPTDGPARYGP